MQGYDSIPREIPDPKAKKVICFFSCTIYIYIYILVLRKESFLAGRNFIWSFDQPADWDEDEDGIWKPAKVPNPAYKGPWKRKVVPYILNYIMFCVAKKFVLFRCFNISYLCIFDRKLRTLITKGSGGFLGSIIQVSFLMHTLSSWLWHFVLFPTVFFFFHEQNSKMILTCMS